MEAIRGTEAPALSVIIQHAVFGLFHILEFALFDRPDEDQPAAGSQAEGKNYQQYDAFIHGV
jgi:hypothetical protein